MANNHPYTPEYLTLEKKVDEWIFNLPTDTIFTPRDVQQAIGEGTDEEVEMAVDHERFTPSRPIEALSLDKLPDPMVRQYKRRYHIQ